MSATVHLDPQPPAAEPAGEPQPGAPAITVRVVIVYYTRFGVLRLLAQRIAEGARSIPGTDVDTLELGDEPLALSEAEVLDRLTGADAVVIGSPSYFGSMASGLKRLFEETLVAAAGPAADRTRPWRAHLLRDKVGAAFCASATPHGGNEMTLHSLLTLLMHLGLLVVTPGQQGTPILANPAAPYGATAIAGPEGDRLPDATEQDEARALGQRVATVARWVRLGRMAEDETAASSSAAEVAFHRGIPG